MGWKAYLITKINSEFKKQIISDFMFLVLSPFYKYFWEIEIGADEA